MAKVKKVIAGVKSRQEIDKLVIMTADAKGYFCGKALLMIVKEDE